MSILLIDDEGDIVYCLKNGLERGENNDGLTVHAFTDPVLALENFQKNPQGYDIAISDIRMPGMTGFQLVREIKKLNPTVKLILMSSFEMSKSEFARELTAKEADFMQKPLRISELRNAILNHLAERNNEQGWLRKT